MGAYEAPAAHVPRRRCVGCGRVAPKPELVRLAVVASAVEDRAVATLDRTGTLPGRGAYLCRDSRRDGPNGECASLASKRGGLQRAFRRALDVPGDLAGSLESESP